MFTIIIIVVVRPLHAQNELIIQEKPSVSSELAGRVDIQITGAPDTNGRTGQRARYARARRPH